MKKVILLSTTIMITPFMVGEAGAQCVATADCASLGYDMPSCSDGKGIKCPYGNKYACPICASSFRYTCSGSYQSPNGIPCKNKYESCSCSDNRTWSNGSCICASSYKYACTGMYQEKPSSASCGGKYTSCNCTAPYSWNNGRCQDMRTPCDLKGCKTGSMMMLLRDNFGSRFYSCSQQPNSSLITHVGTTININNNCIIISNRSLRSYSANELAQVSSIRYDLQNQFYDLGGGWNFNVRAIQKELNDSKQYNTMTFFYDEGSFYKNPTAPCYTPSTNEEKQCTEAMVLPFAILY